MYLIFRFWTWLKTCSGHALYFIGQPWQQESRSWSRSIVLLREVLRLQNIFDWKRMRYLWKLQRQFKNDHTSVQWWQYVVYCTHPFFKLMDTNFNNSKLFSDFYPEKIVVVVCKLNILHAIIDHGKPTCKLGIPNTFTAMT